ncbi:molybdenum cofactor biosynthesis protein A [Catenovulum agarivorans DS-2]|uniref:GTP 3',8-cyclase n=1 Tax=Catenovulum agarivorans DS-2 TaxID=1328313 RepID=W7QQ67_9ALTE|nr:GTP 3',8-cyclase MoaA [Catenovulum agarivorans]EWH10048.1 molybdenum cofactor biosynthesis protein A [Catenovulum agarivorans DS-2]
MLQDKMGRKFHYLRLSITDVCNFKCTYCLPDGYQCDSPRDFLSTSEIGNLVATFASLGTSKVRITGGEPALRKDLAQIIQLCRQQAGITDVALTTNGFNLARNIDKWVDAGLTALNVSIDSLDPKMFSAITGHDKLESILAGLNKAHQLGLKKIKINAVLMRQYNGQDVQDYIDWLKDKPYTLRFIELMQTGDNLQFFKQNHVSGLEIKKLLLEQGWLPVIRDKSAGPAEEFYHPDYQGRVGLIMPYGQDFCASCNRLRVSALGKLHLCLFSEQGIDIRQYLQQPQQQAELTELLHGYLQDKAPSHYLQQGFTGGTQHLAMLGG